MVFHWSLSKSPQDSRTLLSILADFNNAVVWTISTRPVISKSSSPCTNPLVTVVREPIIIGIIVTFMIPSFFNSQANWGTYPSFRILLTLLCGPLESKVNNPASPLFIITIIIIIIIIIIINTIENILFLIFKKSERVSVSFFPVRISLFKYFFLMKGALFYLSIWLSLSRHFPSDATEIWIFLVALQATFTPPLGNAVLNLVLMSLVKRDLFANCFRFRPTLSFSTCHHLFRCKTEFRFALSLSHTLSLLCPIRSRHWNGHHYWINS